MTRVKGEWSQTFKMKDLGPLHHFLVVTNQPSGEIWIAQTSYTEMLLEKFRMNECKPVSTPVNPDVKLSTIEAQDSECNHKMYQGAVESLVARTAVKRKERLRRDHRVLRCRLGGRCWGPKISLRLCFLTCGGSHHMEEQETSECGTIDRRSGVCSTVCGSSRGSVASATND